MDVAIQAGNLSKHYGDVQALAGVDLEVPRGSIYGYLGPNGAGKTTTIEVLTGVREPTRGSASVLGAGLGALDEVKHRIGVVFGENLAPEPGMTPVGYLRYAGRLYGLDDAEIEERARELVEVLDLEAPERAIGKLSGGNKRKVELARALLHRPELVVLDEPTRELDIPSRRAIWTLLETIAEGGTTVFVSSHDPLEIQRLTERVAILREGRITWEGATSELPESEDGQIEGLADRIEGKGVTFSREG